MNDLFRLSAEDIATKVRSGELSAEEVTQASLAAIQAAQSLNAFLHVSSQAALKSARDLDARRARGELLGPLAGLPIAVKDALCTRDAPTTCGSKILVGARENKGWVAPYDAGVVEKLRSADAIIIGKTNMDEFAMGSSNENSAFGPARNPWDVSRVPGGSSGGSAVAVSAGLAPLAIGSDTGGSIRQPAAFTGVVGVKPSYGRVSRYGLVAFASSLDQIGPMARDVRGAALLLAAIAGFDARDSTSADRDVDDYRAACNRDPAGLRIGVPEEYFGAGLDPAVAAAVKQAVARLEARGTSVRPVSLPHTRYGVATYYVLATAEASSNLARFDGVRFGLRVEPPSADLTTLYGATRDAGFGPEVKRRILLGTYVLSAGYYDAYYLKAQQVRTLLVDDFAKAFAEVDVIATPTAPTPAFELGKHSDDPLALYLADAYTLPASLAGISGISVPCGTTPADDNRPELPTGLQLLAPAFEEARLFTLAATLETEYPPRAPTAA